MKQLIRHILREHTREIGEQRIAHNKKTTKDFVKDSKKIHGNNYDYSNSVYLGAKLPININCKKHNKVFTIGQATRHLYGQGCPLCMFEKITTSKSDINDFIKRAKKVHGNKYDYSKVDFKNYGTPVEIICPIHGNFFQKPGNHVKTNKPSGCPDCGNETIGNKLRMTKDDFIKAAKKIHGNKYDYSKINFKNNLSDIVIICPEHGEFLQRVSHHLSGSGCPKCVGKNKTTNDFADAANKIHSNKYDYSLVDYKGAHKNVIILCTTHGDFLQSPANHLAGKGCPYCNESQGEKFVTKLLNNNDLEFTRQFKFIDCTNKLLGRYCRKLRFDFYLPDYNTCIEYDGAQHFVPVEIWGGDEGLKEIQKRDKIKNQYCKKNGIKLIRIPYTMKKEEIEPYILKELGIE